MASSRSIAPPAKPPSERGKNSYQAPTAARSRSTHTSHGRALGEVPRVDHVLEGAGHHVVEAGVEPHVQRAGRRIAASRPRRRRGRGRRRGTSGASSSRIAAPSNSSGSRSSPVVSRTRELAPPGLEAIGPGLDDHLVAPDRASGRYDPSKRSSRPGSIGTGLPAPPAPAHASAPGPAARRGRHGTTAAATGTARADDGLGRRAADAPAVRSGR